MDQIDELDPMEDINKKVSFHLGEMVSMVEEIEKVQGGTAWGVETFILFRANYLSTLDMLVNAIKNLPEHDGLPYCSLEFQMRLEEILLRTEEEILMDEEFFLKGYEEIKGEQIQISAPLHLDLEEGEDFPEASAPQLEEIFPLDEEQDELSFVLGEFMARIHAMESATGCQQSAQSQLDGEGVFMILQLNFENTITMLKQGLQTLPEKVKLHGKTISLLEVKSTWEILAKQDISPEILEKEAFLEGYNRLVAQYQQ